MRAENNSTLILPVNPQQYCTPDSVPNILVKKPKKKRILMIEDDPSMSAVVARALQQRLNCHVDVASDPFEAINRMVENFYDLIILDWQLPGLNGTDTLVEAEKGLRFDPGIPVQWDNSKAPVVIFSAQKKSECLPRRTKHFDYIGYVSKMQSLPEIMKAFSAYLNELDMAKNSTVRQAAN